MKTKLLLKFTFFLLFVNSCSKDDEIIYEDVLPQLKFEVMTDTGTAVSGANISLYNSENDWKNNTNAVKKGLTNTYGNLVIIGLDETAYYFYVEKGSMSNLYDVSQLEKPLKKNTLVTIRVLIK